MITITATTSRLKDFQVTYGDKVTETHLKLAQKIFGQWEKENIYGVFVNESMKMIFAFNTKFADYNKEKSIVEFKDIDDVLISRVEVEKPDKPPRTMAESHCLPHGRGSSKLMHSSQIKNR
jgi:hypothetical protein